MSEETQEHPFLTQEQQQRTHAAETAGNVLRNKEAAKGPFTPSGTSSALVDDIVTLADYIMTGDTYNTNVMRRERAENPLFIALGDALNLEGEDNELPKSSRMPGLGIEFDEGTGPVVGDVGLRVVHDLLTLVEDEIPGGSNRWGLDDINEWTPEQRIKVAVWAGAVHSRASDNDVDIPPAPSVLHEEGCEYNLDHTGKCGSPLDFD